MTFRPSVVPDRDNDIISTFTRSFESARNLVRQDQADKRARILFEQQTRSREQDIEDRERAAAIESGQAGTFDPGRFLEQRPGVVGGQDIAAALTGREPVDERNIFAGQVPDQGPTEGQPRLIAGQGGAPNIFAEAGQAPPAPTLERPSLIAGVGGAPSIVTPPEFGAGGAQVITEPSREERLQPGFQPAGDLPEDAVRLPGGRMFSASLQRLRLREEEAEDIVAEAAAKETTAPGERDAAREEREVAEFEGMSPREQKLLQGQADAFVRAFPTEMAEIPPENVIERVRFGEILQRRAELLARDEGLGSVAGRQRETQIQRIVDRLRNEAGFEEGVPPGAEGQALLDRWRALAEAQVDASAEDAPGEDVRTADLVSAADLAAMSETEISDIESTADAFINEISESTRGLGGIQEELQQATSRQRRVIQPLLLQRVTALWTDPVAPWSEPENRPGVGFTVFGGRPGGDVFADVRSPQEIVDIMMGIN